MKYKQVFLLLLLLLLHARPLLLQLCWVQPQLLGSSRLLFAPLSDSARVLTEVTELWSSCPCLQSAPMIDTYHRPIRSCGGQDRARFEANERERADSGDED